MKRFAAALAVAALFISSTSFAKTLMLEGRLKSAIAMRQQMEFSVDSGPVQSFTFKFALPADYQSKSVSQTVDALNAKFDPQPASSAVEKDRFGNRFQKVTWNNVDRSIRINLGYTANIRSELSAMESRTPFPIGKVSGGDATYLKSTELVQSEAPEIAELARSLTAGTRSEYEAVTAITNHVTDRIKYTYNPPKFDALYTLETKSGNCQNFAHLSIALLRSVGIPARIVGGITLKDPWKVPVDGKNSIVQSMGQGGHAWMEIYFPDLGWLPYDPQQSRQFTSSRHIKQTHGLDSRDINDNWRGSPYLPSYSESIDGTFATDEVQLKVKSSGKDPRPYIISNLVKAAAGGGTPVPDAAADAERRAREQAEKERLENERLKKQRLENERLKKERLEAERLAELKREEERKAKESAEKKRLAKEREEAERLARLKGEQERRYREQAEKDRLAKERLAKEREEAVRLARLKEEQDRLEAERLRKGENPPRPGTPLVFGNMEFPNLVSAYSVQGNTGTRILDKETSEYVTSHYIFAQAFTVKSPLAVEKISLAMRKFGGDGNVYIDLVADGGGKPDILSGVRSGLVSLEKITRKPGYYWVDFGFADDPRKKLKPGKYWIVLRSSGEAIMNWFYIPGKPYDERDDTRSSAKGFQWEDILNYDFVFRVSGKAL